MMLGRNGDILYGRLLYTRSEHVDLHPGFRPIDECPAFVRKEMGIPFAHDIMDVEAPAFFRRRLRVKLLLKPEYSVPAWSTSPVE